MIELNEKKIFECIENNYSSFQETFYKIKIEILVDVYKKFTKDLDEANIIIYFNKEFHKSILNQKTFNLNYDISYNNYWNSIKNINQQNIKIINISKETGLPKETVRRKVDLLVKKKLLSRVKNKIYWKPGEKLIKNYNELAEKQVKIVSQLINLLSHFLDKPVNSEEIKDEINKLYSFYWFHYLSSFLTWCKNWQSKIPDLEMILIFLQCSKNTFTYFKKNKIEKLSDLITKNLTSKYNYLESYISATSISLSTGMPRSTCIRKLNKLVKLNILKKDKKTKKYYFDISTINESSITNKKTRFNNIKSFNFFYLVSLKPFIK